MAQEDYDPKYREWKEKRERKRFVRVPADGIPVHRFASDVHGPLVTRKRKVRTARLAAMTPEQRANRKRSQFGKLPLNVKIKIDTKRRIELAALALTRLRKQRLSVLGNRQANSQQDDNRHKKTRPCSDWYASGFSVSKPITLEAPRAEISQKSC